jgi:hypothetical protein
MHTRLSVSSLMTLLSSGGNVPEDICGGLREALKRD